MSGMKFVSVETLNLSSKCEKNQTTGCHNCKHCRQMWEEAGISFRAEQSSS
jgi:hypothetical protein